MSNQFYYYLVHLNEYDRKKKLEGSFAMNLDEFHKRWKEYSNKFNFPYAELEVSIENKIANIKVSNYGNITFIGNIIDFGNEKILKTINMIALGDGSPQLGVNIFIAIGILIACVNPKEDAEFRGKILNNLGLPDIKIGSKSSTVINGLQYVLNWTKEVGIWFSIKNV